MLVCVVGTSTAFTYWAFGVVWAVLEEFSGAVHHVHCTTVAQMREQWEKRDGRPVLFTTDYLEPGLSSLIANTGMPILVIADTAEVAIVTAAKYRPLSYLDSIRHTSMYICSLAEILDTGRARIFGSHYRESLLNAFLPVLVEAINVPGDEGLYERVLRRICPDEAVWETISVDAAIKLTQPSVSVEEFLPDWSERQIDAFHRVARDYQAVLDGKSIQQVTWPAAILHSQVPDYTTENPLSLIGPARPLIWGPYMHVPKGKWVASMEFEVSDGHSPNTVVAAVLLGGDFVVQGELDLPIQGMFIWNLDFEVKDVSRPIEVRMTLARSAIEGTFYLREVRLSRAQD